MLKQFSISLNDPPYNLYLHSSPLRAGILPGYHWHVELFPRLSRIAGFETGTDVFINTVVPEEAASFIRSQESVLTKGGS